MKRHLALLFVFGLFSVCATSSRAQRSFGTQQIVVDDGSSHTITVLDPAGLTGNYTWTIPIDPTTGLSSAFVPQGTTNNSTLRWDNGTSSWLENTNVLADNSGNIVAASIGNSAGILSASISFPTAGLEQGIVLSSGTQNVYIDNSQLNMVGGGITIGNTLLDNAGNIFTSRKVVMSTESDDVNGPSGTNTVNFSGNKAVVTVTDLTPNATGDVTASTSGIINEGQVLYLHNA